MALGDSDRETMGFYISPSTGHTAKEQGHGTIVFYCAHPGRCPSPVPGPKQHVGLFLKQGMT